ncbi:hypothetical protein ACFWY9_18940 [Amycolatopsis sp. NPDC059027]
MTNMREREAQRRCPAAAIACPCSPNDHRMPFSWQEHGRLSGVGSPP